MILGNGKSSLTFVTAVNYNKNILRQLNSITFLADTNWSIGNNKIPTLPVAFFHVEKHNEVLDSEVSTKQMLFYDSNEGRNKENISTGLLNIVADNIVNKPKQYKMSILVPSDNLSLMSSSYIFNSDQRVAINAFISGNTFSNVDLSGLNTLHTTLEPVRDILQMILKDLVKINDKSSASFISSIMETPNYNKNSLEAMRNNRSILKLKTWDSWRYKYVMINNLDFSKEPTEDGVWRATLSVTEVPMAQVAKISREPSIKLFSNPALELVGKTMIKAIDTLGGIADGN